MKEICEIRRVDELGRVVIPVQLRRKLDIGEKALLEITLEGDRLVLKKHRPACTFCGSFRELALFRDKYVCTACREKLSEFRGEPI